LLPGRSGRSALFLLNCHVYYGSLSMNDWQQIKSGNPQRRTPPQSAGDVKCLCCRRGVALFFEVENAAFEGRHAAAEECFVSLGLQDGLVRASVAVEGVQKLRLDASEGFHESFFRVGDVALRGRCVAV